ncbi:MAG: clostripain-related cysteine peptidase [Pseudomonadota bacterium]
MKITVADFLFCVALVIFPMLAVAQVAPPKADWTMLVYVNGKNSLESAAITDFYEMAEVGSSPRVQVIAQVGRPKQHYSTVEGGWSGVYRFRVVKGMKPRPANAVVDLQKEGLNTDMANPDTLEDFVRWGTRTYPAKKTMLVIWNHGQGFRFLLDPDPKNRIIAAKQIRSATEMQVFTGLRGPAVTSGHRAVSSDDDSKGILYNRQIQDTLEKLSKQGIPLDVIGFDACLMSMVETAYALRKIADYMVASEELEPGNGWNYRTILRKLNIKPEMDASELAQEIVSAYENQYQDGDRTTLSTLNLKKVDDFAKSLSDLSNYLLQNISVQKKYISAARSDVRSFGDWDQPPMQTSIDLKLFLSKLKDNNPDKIAVQKIDNTLSLLKNVVVNNYRSAPVSDDGYGGNGLAIYFPESKKIFKDDRFGDGYLPTNTIHPLEFVTSPQTSGWSRLVLKMLE